MKIEQIYTSCLAQGAYYIESLGEVAIIDPLREVKPYLERVNNDNAKIKYIFETHFHADFVSGHVTLSETSGAPIVFGPTANPSFQCHIAKDNEVFKIGEITITALHTPGHTMESTCYLLKNKNGKNHAIFTGDTLFLGDVGRPDLAQKSAEITQEQLAATLYKSLRNKIMVLEDDVIVYPAHGAGSACGKNLSKETIGTIGEQKLTNYALRTDMSEAEFVQEVTNGLLPPPAYFPKNVSLNKNGYENVNNIIKKNKAFNAKTFELIANQNSTLILDVRNQDDFCKSHIANSIFIGLNGQFAPWVGALITDIQQPILLICPIGKETETITRLSRVGYDNTLGYLEGGFESWQNAGFETVSISGITAYELSERIKTDNLQVFDVRKPGEFNNEHLDVAFSSPLDFLNDHLAEFPKKEDFYIHCAGGYRSVIAISILKKLGIKNIIDIKGGYDALKLTDLLISSKVCSKGL